MKHWTYGEIFTEAGKLPERAITLTLRKGDTAPLPGTTKRHFAGPGKVTYYAWTDGGMDIVDSERGMLVYAPQPTAVPAS